MLLDAISGCTADEKFRLMKSQHYGSSTLIEPRSSVYELNELNTETPFSNFDHMGTVDLKTNIFTELVDAGQLLHYMVNVAIVHCQTYVFTQSKFQKKCISVISSLRVTT